MAIVTVLALAVLVAAFSEPIVALALTAKLLTVVAAVPTPRFRAPVVLKMPSVVPVFSVYHHRCHGRHL